MTRDLQTNVLKFSDFNLHLIVLFTPFHFNSISSFCHIINLDGEPTRTGFVSIAKTQNDTNSEDSIFFSNLI